MTQKKKTNEIESLLNRASLHTEDHIHVDEPSLEYFEELVQKQTETWYRRLWVELVLLWILSFVLLSTLAVTVFYAPSLFLAIQVTSLVILGGYFIKENLRTVAWKQ
jgi:hypothetical protein